MPRGDGTGPPNDGAGNWGRGRGRRGLGGTVGTCVCPQCGHVQQHERGKPCAQTTCEKCGAVMTRKQ